MNVSPDLDARFRATAVRSGLLEASYDIVDSAIGPLLVAATDRGVLRISFEAEPEAHLESIGRLVGPRVLRASTALEAIRRELDEYFTGRRQAFDLSLDLRGQPDFSLRVLAELARVPFGETATYGDLAGRVGSPKGARAVGLVMNRNPIPIVLPCHRIVGANGSLTGYAGGLHVKEHLLRLEGVLF